MRWELKIKPNNFKMAKHNDTYEGLDGGGGGGSWYLLFIKNLAH